MSFLIGIHHYWEESIWNFSQAPMTWTQHQLRYKKLIYRISTGKRRISSPSETRKPSLRYKEPYGLMDIYRILTGKRRHLFPLQVSQRPFLWSKSHRQNLRGLILVNAVLIGIETDFAVPRVVWGSVVPMWCKMLAAKMKQQGSPGMIE